MTTWISTREANELADTSLTDRRFRDKFRPLIRHRKYEERGIVRWDRDAVIAFFGEGREIGEIADAAGNAK